MSPTGSLTSAAIEMLIAIRRLTPSLAKLIPALRPSTSARSASVSRLASSAPGMKLPGIRMPCCGCRTRAKASAPASCLRRMSTFGWYQNSTQLFFSASARPTRAAAGWRNAELLLGDDLLDRRGLERLLEHRQHAQLVLLADLLEVFQHRRAAVAHQLHRAGVAEPAQRLDRLDRVAGVQIDVEEDQVRRRGASARRGTPRRRRIPSCRCRCPAGSATRNAGCCSLRR